MSKSVKHLVVDSGALIAGVNLLNLGEEFWTITEVLQEIRDSRSRALLAALPFELKTRVPSDEAIKFVRDFAGKTGDLRVLSLVDIKVLALAYMLEKENNGVKGLRTEPAAENTKSIPGIERIVGRNVKDEVCLHVETERGCRRGDLCPYRHPEDITESELIADEMVDELVENALDNSKNILKVQENKNVVKKTWGVTSNDAPVVIQDDEEYPSLSDSMVIPLAIAAAEFPGLDLPTIDIVRKRLAEGRKNNYGENEESIEEEEISEEDLEGNVRESLLDTPIQFKSVASKLKAMQEKEREEKILKKREEKRLFDLEEEKEDEDVFSNLKITPMLPSEGRKDGKSHILFSSGGADVAVYEDDDDGEGWSGPGQKASSSWGLGAVAQEEVLNISVGCITTDYAMQNILLQIGLKLISLEGRLVSRIKQWTLSCIGCFTIEKDLTKMFCTKCGGNTLEKISFFVDKHGNTRYGYSRHRDGAKRGQIYGLPNVKGGRATDLILREDQMLMGKWRQQAMAKGELQSVFGEDITGSLGIKVASSNNLVVGFGNKNPNEMKGRERRGKKRNVKLRNGLKA